MRITEAETRRAEDWAPARRPEPIPNGRRKINQTPRRALPLKSPAVSRNF